MDSKSNKYLQSNVKSKAIAALITPFVISTEIAFIRERSINSCPTRGHLIWSPKVYAKFVPRIEMICSSVHHSLPIPKMALAPLIWCIP